MAAPLNWSGQIVDNHGNVYGSLTKGEQPAQIVVRRNVARVTLGTAVLAERSGVAAVTATGTLTRTVVFDDHTEWTVERPKRAGCGCR